MPAQSKAQRKLFGIARAVQKGDVPASDVSGAASKIAKDVSPSEVDKFAKTKETGLPQYKEQKLREYIRKYIKECMDEIDNEPEHDELNEAAFSRQHYNAIANIIANSDDKEQIAYALADIFERDNPLFKKDKFLQAAGIV